MTGTGAFGRTQSGQAVLRGGLRARAFCGRPCDLPGCASSAYLSVSFARWFSIFIVRAEEVVVSSAGRAVGLDVHLEFCEMAVCENGQVRSAGRVDTKPEALEALAASLLPTDRLALEVMGASWEIVRILEPDRKPQQIGRARRIRALD